ncbi:MAG: glycosyltransferase [Phycisphaerales bacterium JB041]
MDAILLMVTLVGLAAAAALAVYWSVALYQTIRTIVLLPTARDGLTLPPPGASVCVVVPAHNEAKVIGNLVHSLRQQDYKHVRFVLALDRCTDETAAIARGAAGPDERFEIFEIESCPDDWAGKVNAMWTAMHRSEHARGAEFLLFVDADTTLHPGCVRATVALAQERKLDLLSLMSTLTTDTWFERVVQPVAALELMRQYPPLRASRAERRRAFANGQFILFRAKPYWAFGGHERVKDHLLEDLGISRVAADEGLPAGLLNADGVLICRMYHTWAEFRKGWKRIYTECANRKPRRLSRATVRVRIIDGLLPVLACLGAVAALSGSFEPGWARVTGAVVCLIGLVVWSVALAAIYRLSRAPLWSVPLYPLASWRVSGILREAAQDLIHDRPTEWGGRAYSRVSR